MKPEIVRRIAEQMATLGWKSRFELAMHGEPTLNPLAAECVAEIRRALPKTHIMMTSNGGGLLAKPGPVERIAALFKAGLNVLALDDYLHANIVPKIREAVHKDRTDEESGPVLASVNIFECPEQPEGNPYRRHPASYKMLSFIKDLSETGAEGGNGIRSHINNGCGAAGPLNDRMAGKRCARPFRELAIRWDGTVDLCCNNWRGGYAVGNVAETSLNDLWQAPALQVARRKLYHGERSFGPCKGCDSHSFRVGLLPDPVGKCSLPKANADDDKVIAATLAKGLRVTSVRRDWE
jgi:hypothetical protein